MADYVRIFAVENIVRIHEQFDRDFRLAEQIDRLEAKAGLPRTARATLMLLERAYLDFNRALDDLGRKTALDATVAIKDRIRATRATNRGDTGRGQHLRNAIKSRSLGRINGLATGAVGVADVSVLDALHNPMGYGPYWRAQEYGTGTPEVPSQKDRVIRGYFFGRGYAGSPSAPSGQYRGLGVGPHPIFVSGRAGAAMFGALGVSGGPGSRGGMGGFGTISVELPGRHFIRDGAATAEATWRRGLAAIEYRTLRDMRAAVRLP